MNGSTSTLRLCAAALLLALYGCGGGSGSGGGYSGGSVTGVWTGSLTTRAGGSLEIDFTQTGANLTGMARLTLAGTPPAIYTGTFTGTITNPGIGASVDITVTWSDASYGSSHFTGTIQPDGSLSVNYTRGSDQGTASVSKTNQSTPTNLANTVFSGYYQQTGDSTQNPVAISITSQDADALHISVVGKNDQSANGVIIGSHVTIVIPDTGGSGTTMLDGTLNNGTVTGTFRDSSGKTGTFSVTKASGTASIAGVWAGSSTSTTNGILEWDLTQTGGTLGGTARLSFGTGASATVYTGTVAGNVVGNTAALTITWAPASYGLTSLLASCSSSGMSGTYERDASGTTEKGTFSLSKGSATVALSANYSGYYIDSSDANHTHNPLALTVTSQTGNSVVGTISVTNGGGTQSSPATGIIIGSHLTIGVQDNGGGGTTAVDGSVSGSSITGTFASTNNSGTFVLNTI